MPFKEGDFLEIEYSAWDAANSILIVTTDEKAAKGSGIYNDNEKTKYGKVLVVLGSNGVVKGLDSELRKMSVNETKKFTLKPEEAFGQRDEELVRVMRLSDFKARDVNPYPGMVIDLDNMQATVRSVNSGRVVVDANNPYAGRDITYEVKVVGHLTKEEDKAKALAGTYNVNPSSLKIDGSNLTMAYDSKVSKNADYFIGKASAIASIFNYLKGIGDIKIEEDYKRPEEKKQEDHKVE